MGWEEWMVGVEYDGEQHWKDPAAYEDDINRLEFLAARGWRIVRVSANHLRLLPDEVVQRASDALRARGCPL
jgi:very-short-patch-repair endonuclease